MYQGGIAIVSPVDSERQSYGQHLFAQLAMFMVGHELAHITRGHVDYLRSERISSFVSELGWQGSGADATLELQALEFDADRRAVLARSVSMYDAVENGAGSKAQPWSKNGQLFSVESLQFDWAFAANVMYRLFGDRVFTKLELENSTHPPMPLRRRMAMDYANAILLGNWTKDEETVHRTIGGAIKATEMAFLAIGAPEQGGGFTSAFSEESNAHVTKIAELTEEIAPALNKHAYEEIVQS